MRKMINRAILWGIVSFVCTFLLEALTDQGLLLVSNTLATSAIFFLAISLLVETKFFPKWKFYMAYKETIRNSPLSVRLVLTAGTGLFMTLAVRIVFSALHFAALRFEIMVPAIFLIGFLRPYMKKSEKDGEKKAAKKEASSPKASKPSSPEQKPDTESSPLSFVEVAEEFAKTSSTITNEELEEERMACLEVDLSDN